MVKCNRKLIVRLTAKRGQLQHSPEYCEQWLAIIGQLNLDPTAGAIGSWILELTCARPVGLGIFWIMAEDAIILAVLAVSLVLKSTVTGSGPEGKPDRLQAIISWKVQSGLGLKTSIKVDTPHFPERFQ